MPRVRSEAPRSPAKESAIDAVKPAVPALPRRRAVLWLAIVTVIAAFIALGSIYVGAGKWIGRRLPVREIWARFVRFLVDQGASSGIVLIVTAAVWVALIGAGYALWLALGLEDQQPDATNDDSPGQ